MGTNTPTARDTMDVASKRCSVVIWLVVVLAIVLVVLFLRRPQRRETTSSPPKQKSTPPSPVPASVPVSEVAGGHQVVQLPAMLTHWPELPGVDALPLVPRHPSEQTQPRLQLRVSPPATVDLLTKTGEWIRGAEGNGRSAFFTDEEEASLVLVTVSPPEGRELTLVDGSNTVLMQTMVSSRVMDWPVLEPRWRPILTWRRALGSFDQQAWTSVESEGTKLIRNPEKGCVEISIPADRAAPLPSLLLGASLRVRRVDSRMLLVMHGETAIPGLEGSPRSGEPASPRRQHFRGHERQGPPGGADGRRWDATL